MFSVPCPRHFPAYCFPQINFPVSLNVQLIVRHLCWLYCVVRDGIVRDGMLRGWGFHIFKIAGNFNFSFNYEIPVGDFILFLVFLLFFFFFSFSYWFCEPEKNLAGRPGKGMPNYQKLVLKGFSEGHEPSLKLKIFRTKKFIKKKLFKLKF